MPMGQPGSPSSPEAGNPVPEYPELPDSSDSEGRSEGEEAAADESNWLADDNLPEDQVRQPA